jgi:hypothetical protein
MNIVNHTPFPAQVFEAVDQYEQQFHVAVMRQTLSFATGVMEYADEQVPLCDTDRMFADGEIGIARQESDYCPFKPRCDVVVNATAYAPNGVPARNFMVQLRVMRGASCLLDKSLTVSGERSFKKNSWFVRLVQWAVKWGSLTLVRPIPWSLTNPELCTSLPLRNEYAFGGQCRIIAGEAASKRVPSEHRLAFSSSSEGPENSPDQSTAIAHTVFDGNPFGRGFVEAWYLHATGKKEIPAPRIEKIGASISQESFWAFQTPSKRRDEAHSRLIDPAGFGIRAKSHPFRRAMVGNVDTTFTEGNAPIPAEFDFSIWNCAPADQQIDYLRGGEIFELVNLCKADTPSAQADEQGNTVLKLQRLEHECYTLFHLDDGEMVSQPLLVDTVVIEPDEGTVTLIWRAVLPKNESASIQECEFRMREIDAMDRVQCRVSTVQTLVAGLPSADHNAMVTL